MAEGGEEFGREQPELDYQIDHDDDDDEQEVNRTQPFQPGSLSTPYHGGEQVEMQTMQHEQSGLPGTSYEETPLLGAQAEQQRSWDYLTSIFPEASATDLETSYSKTGRLQVKMMGFGKKLYELFTKEKGTGKQHLNPSLTKEIKNSLGPMAQELIDQQNESIRTELQNLIDDEKKLKEGETLVAEKEKATKNVKNFREKLNRTRAQINAIEDEHGSNLEIQADLRRLKLLEKNLENDLKEEKKRFPSLKNK